jgi:hypothetical protein
MGIKTVVKVKHRASAGGGTVCTPNKYIGFGSTVKVNKTWKGVTCQRCLKKRPVAKAKTFRVGASI